jgi:hypothetical protein
MGLIFVVAARAFPASSSYIFHVGDRKTPFTTPQECADEIVQGYAKLASFFDEKKFRFSPLGAKCEPKPDGVYATFSYLVGARKVELADSLSQAITDAKHQEAAGFQISFEPVRAIVPHFGLQLLKDKGSPRPTLLLARKLEGYLSFDNYAAYMDELDKIGSGLESLEVLPLAGYLHAHLSQKEYEAVSEKMRSADEVEVSSWPSVELENGTLLTSEALIGGFWRSRKCSTSKPCVLPFALSPYYGSSHALWSELTAR